MFSIEFSFNYAAWLALLLVVGLLVNHQADRLEESIGIYEQFNQQENQFLNCRSFQLFTHAALAKPSFCFSSNLAYD